MKTDIHPTYHTNVKVTCACGNTFVTGSTTDAIQVEVCSNCHPFFTGKSKLLDSAGRVDKFKARLERAQAFKTTKKPTGKLVDEPKDIEQPPMPVEEPEVTTEESTHEE